MPDLEGNKKGEETSTPLHAYKDGREDEVAEEGIDAGGSRAARGFRRAGSPTAGLDPVAALELAIQQ